MFDTSTMSRDTPDNSTSYTVDGLISATTYTVFLSAFTGAGEGNMSSEVIDKTTFGNLW